jgi:hypothetical protein
MIHRESKSHVDDMMAKSQTERGHPVDLGQVGWLVEITHTIEPESMHLGGAVHQAAEACCKSEESRLILKKKRDKLQELLIPMLPRGMIVNLVLGSPRGVYEVRTESAWLVLSKRVCNLPKQKVYRRWNNTLTVRKNLMYFGIGCSPTETVYADSYHFVYIQNGFG